MTLDLARGWTALIHSPLLGIALTIGAYQLSRELWRRTHGHSLVNPVLVAMAIVAAVLLGLHISYDDYLSGAQYISFLLGPATVALAVPLHRQAANIRATARPILAAVLVGSVTAIVAALVVTSALGGDRGLALSMAPKSVTTPVAIALAQTTGGVPALAAVFTILTGVLGAVAAPWVLTVIRIRDRRIRGLAIGMSSHGIGTSRAFHEDPVTGAFSALAMALNAVATAVVLPLILAITPW